MRWTRGDYIQKKKLIVVLIILVTFIGIMSFYLLKTLPNTDASGFLISINNSGGSSCYCSATLIEEDGTAYYILLDSKCDDMKANYSFQNHECTFYFESKDELDLTLAEINYVINKTEFFKEKFYLGEKDYRIYYCVKIIISRDEVNELKRIIHDSGFLWFDYKYEYNFFTGIPGGEGPIIITIPEYHKKVEASPGNAPEGFKRIYSYIYDDSLGIHPGGENYPFP